MNLLRELRDFLVHPSTSPPAQPHQPSEAQRRVEEEIALLQEPKHKLERAINRRSPADAIREAREMREGAR